MANEQLNTFVVPRPNSLLMSIMAPVNRVIMLRGLPMLRDFAPFDRVPGLRGVANVRHVDFPDADRARLSTVSGPGKATFYAPNHPEFFTDWMIDKEIQSQVAPLCASWATNGVVNGLGALVQRFWLANNLIAQIPGNSAPARAYSVEWAVKGNGVLLHPEGMVGWHGDVVAPLMPGAAEMALAALAKGHQTDAAFEAWIAPIVWKLAFTRDVESELAAECAYVERRLGLGQGRPAGSPAMRVFAIYDALLARDEANAGVKPDPGAAFAVRQRRLVGLLEERLDGLLPPRDKDDTVLSRARRWLRENKPSDDARAVRLAADTLQRLCRVGPFAWAKPMMSQEHVAEHLKRIRNDYCRGTMRDTLNAFVPQPAGPRTAHIRVPPPLAMHSFPGAPEEAMTEIRRRMQAALDAINAELVADRTLKTYPNPFYEGSAA